MRYSSWVIQLIISVSLVTGSGELYAAKATHKSAKVSKSIRSASKKSKIVQGPRDIWERIRTGMQIQRPTPVSSDLTALLAAETPPSPTPHQSEKSTSTAETDNTQHPVNTILKQTADCEPDFVPKPRLRNTYPLTRTNPNLAIHKPTRIHVQFKVKAKPSKSKASQTIENLDPADTLEETPKLIQEMAAEDDAAENLIPTNSIDAEMKALQTRDEKTATLPKPEYQAKAPCLKSTRQNLIAENDSSPPLDIEAIRQQALRYERVHTFILRYTQAPGFLANVTERSRPYIYHIVTSLSKAKMPLELALLPIVESAYQPKAESPKSAAGLWQFIPSTGVDFRLEQTALYDDRLDIIESTDAAIRYLGFLKQHYKGDWLLALAAYNCGQGAVDAAIGVNQANGLATDFWALQLPEETKEYVPRLLALASIFANPGSYKVAFAKIKNEPYFAKVNVAQAIDIKHLLDKEFSTIAQLADLSYDQFNLLNPGYLSTTLSSAHPFTFLIPISKVKLLNQRLQMLAQIATEEQKAIPEFSIVKTSVAEPASTTNDTPFIALDFKNSATKHPISEKILDQSVLTTLLDKDILKIQAVQPSISFNLEQSQTANLRKDHTKVQKRLQIIASNSPETPKKPNTMVHALRQGETLRYLAQRYQVSEDAIRTMNHFSRHQNFQAGQQIRIPSKKIRIAINDKKELLTNSKRQIN